MTAAGHALSGSHISTFARAVPEIEIRVVAFEIRRVGDFMAGLRQPLVQDGVPGAADRGDMVAYG